jgi:putative ABC transport system substrate-binding protein
LTRPIKPHPVFGSEIDQVKAGCVGCEGLDYYDLGVQTARCCQGIKRGSQSFRNEVSDNLGSSAYINTMVAKEIGITVPDEYLNAQDTQVFSTVDDSTQSGTN